MTLEKLWEELHAEISKLEGIARPDLYAFEQRMKHMFERHPVVVEAVPVAVVPGPYAFEQRQGVVVSPAAAVVPVATPSFETLVDPYVAPPVDPVIIAPADVLPSLMFEVQRQLLEQGPSTASAPLPLEHPGMPGDVPVAGADVAPAVTEVHVVGVSGGEPSPVVVAGVISSTPTVV